MHSFSLNLLDIDIDLDALAKNSMIPYIDINEDITIYFHSIIPYDSYGMVYVNLCFMLRKVTMTLVKVIYFENVLNYFFIKKSSVDFSSAFSKLSVIPKIHSILSFLSSTF